MLPLASLHTSLRFGHSIFFVQSVTVSITTSLKQIVNKALDNLIDGK